MSLVCSIKYKLKRQTMKQSIKGGLLFVLIIIIAFAIGSYILTSVFFGVLTLVGLVVLIESIPPLKWLLSKTSRVLDVAIFIFTIAAMASYGLNITAALTVAGVGYTLVYAPYLREQAIIKKNNKSNINRPQPKRT